MQCAPAAAASLLTTVARALVAPTAAATAAAARAPLPAVIASAHLSTHSKVAAAAANRRAAAAPEPAQRGRAGVGQSAGDGPLGRAIGEDPRLAGFFRTRWPYLALLGAGTSTLLFYSVFREPAVTQRCYLDLEDEDGQPRGRVVLGLFGDDAPQTVDNFVALASQARGFGYRGAPIHRVMQGFTVWGGDVTRGDGSGGVSASGPSIGVETMSVRHRRGTLSMALDESGRVRSQFFVTLVTSPALDRKAVAFGKVLDDVSRVPVDGQHRPLSRIVIRDCGMLPPQPP